MHTPGNWETVRQSLDGSAVVSRKESVEGRMNALAYEVGQIVRETPA
jgi:hypothetical protein